MPSHDPDARAPLDGLAAAPLEELYRRYAGWLGKALSARLRSSALEVDDLVQETYLRAARYTGPDTARHPKALLLRIAVNLARDQMRRRVVRGGLSAPVTEACLEESAAPPEQHTQLELKQAILALPPIYRDVFVLSRFTGLTYDEIASHLGISVKTVEWRMSRALAMCAERLLDC